MLHKCLIAVWLVCHNRAMLLQYHRLVIMETFQTMSKCIAAIVQCACSVVYFRHIKVFCYVVISQETFEVIYSFLSARTAVGNEWKANFMSYIFLFFFCKTIWAVVFTYAHVVCGSILLPAPKCKDTQRPKKKSFFNHQRQRAAMQTH